MKVEHVISFIVLVFVCNLIVACKGNAEVVGQEIDESVNESRSNEELDQLSYSQGEQADFVRDVTIVEYEAGDLPSPYHRSDVVLKTPPSEAGWKTYVYDYADYTTVKRDSIIERIEQAEGVEDFLELEGLYGVVQPVMEKNWIDSPIVGYVQNYFVEDIYLGGETYISSSESCSFFLPKAANTVVFSRDLESKLIGALGQSSYGDAGEFEVYASLYFYDQN